ncbi:unnamed protein product [Nippostrongylus brasiliensis]|uniref:SHSP domain-containing protein n=1 Tax=Nippostrongylus brasiliensis TaxID=27835 RepID=A0A0N4YDQ4_NIPBR|nr:unnamed protein product [Nippostrongylus brasiliensis]
MSLWRRPRSPSWSMDSHFEEMSRRIDRALAECRRDMRRFEESFFPSSRYGEAQRVSDFYLLVPDLSRNGGSFVRKWTLPQSADIEAIESRLSDSGRLSVEVPKMRTSDGLQRSVEYFQTSDDDKKFAVTLDVSQFKPEELKVNLDGRVLVVEGRQQQKDDKSFMSRSFIRSWCLPEEVDLNGLKTELTNDGKLVIEAPKNPPASGSNRRNIPISHSSGSKQQQESSDRQVNRRSRHSDREDPYHSPSDRGSRRR